MALAGKIEAVTASACDRSITKMKWRAAVRATKACGQVGERRVSARVSTRVPPGVR
jgi:hypothetical protein